VTFSNKLHEHDQYEFTLITYSKAITCLNLASRVIVFYEQNGFNSLKERI